MPAMTRLTLIICLLVTTQAWAGWKFFGPDGQFVNGTETAQERAKRERLEQRNLQDADYARATTPKTVFRKQKKYSTGDLLRGKPAEPAEPERQQPRDLAGGHRRHEFRAKTGFNTPAERDRYLMEIQRLKKQLRKERARPDPRGQRMPSF